MWASPVYAGRLPNKTLDFVTRNLRGDNTPILLVAVYGGRHFDNALSEMALIARQNGFRPVAAAAVVARHVFSKTLSAGRPNDDDVVQIEAFADGVDFSQCGVLELPGETVPSSYYTPLREDLTPARFLKALPVVDDSLCSHCGSCVSLCPMGSITVNHSLPQFQGVCIKCQACVCHCPQHAVGFDDADFLSHVRMLESTYTAPAPNHFFYTNNIMVGSINSFFDLKMA